MPNLTVAAVQTNPIFGEVEKNLQAAMDLIPAECDLAVLPELFASGYQFRNQDELQALSEPLAGTLQPGSVAHRLGEFAADRGLTLVAGLAEQADGRFYNSSVLLRPDGSHEIYRKVHLFNSEKELFTPGDLGFPVFPACGTTVGMMVCFDWMFPEAARSLALAGAQIIVHPSNLLLPWCPEAMVTRCLENRVFAVTSNRIGTEARTDETLTFIGMSEVVSPLGEILGRLDRQNTGATLAEVDLGLCSKQITPGNHLWKDRRCEAYRS